MAECGDRRSVAHRVAGALLVLYGGAVGVAMAWLYAFLGGHMLSTFRRLRIEGGLPQPTVLALRLATVLKEHPYAFALAWLAVVAVLALNVSCARSKRALTHAGVFVAAAFLAWYAALFLLMAAFLLPIYPF